MRACGAAPEPTPPVSCECPIYHHHFLHFPRHTFSQAVIADSFSDHTKENKTATASVMNRSIAQWGSPLRAVSSADRCAHSSMCFACAGQLSTSQLVVKCACSSLWSGAPSPHRWLFPPPPFVRRRSGSPDVDMEADAVPDAPDASLYEQEQERDGDSGAEEIRSPQMLPHGMHNG